MTSADYGQAGLFGIGTPQANPTVEAELRILLPPASAMVVSRLTSASPDPGERLRSYLVEIDRALAQYDTLRPDAYGFCCTASSYLLPQGEEDRILGAAEARFGFPIFSASAAIVWHLRRIGVHRLALASPYPRWLAEAAATFWQGQGFDVVAAERVESGSDDTRSIYGLGSEDGRAAAAALCQLDVDAVLLSGTGMPTLRLIASSANEPPLLSSNLCMAMRLCVALGVPEPEPDDWRRRLALASPSFQESDRP